MCPVVLRTRVSFSGYCRTRAAGSRFCAALFQSTAKPLMLWHTFRPQSMMIAKHGQMRKVEGEKLEVLYEGNRVRCRWVEPTKGLYGCGLTTGCARLDIRFELNYLVWSPFSKRTVVGDASHWKDSSSSKLSSSIYVFDQKRLENSRNVRQRQMTE